MTPETQTAFLKIREDLRKLIYFWAHRYKSNAPGCEFEDLCQTGELRLLEIFQTRAYASMSEKKLKAILGQSLKNVMVDALRAKAPIDQPATRIDLDAVAEMVGESGFEAIYLQHLVDYLSHFVSEEAGQLLQNLIQPSQEVIHEDLKQSLRREHLRRQGVRIPHSTKLTHTLVGFALGFTPSRTKLLVRELQVAYCHYVVPFSGASCPRLFHSLTQN